MARQINCEKADVRRIDLEIERVEMRLRQINGDVSEYLEFVSGDDDVGDEIILAQMDGRAVGYKAELTALRQLREKVQSALGETWEEH